MICTNKFYWLGGSEESSGGEGRQEGGEECRYPTGKLRPEISKKKRREAKKINDNKVK